MPASTATSLRLAARDAVRPPARPQFSAIDNNVYVKNVSAGMPSFSGAGSEEQCIVALNSPQTEHQAPSVRDQKHSDYRQPGLSQP
jgi:hypothetical protein